MSEVGRRRIYFLGPLGPIRPLGPLRGRVSEVGRDHHNCLKVLIVLIVLIVFELSLQFKPPSPIIILRKNLLFGGEIRNFA